MRTGTEIVKSAGSGGAAGWSRLASALTCAALAWCESASAQQFEQVLDLRAGWNAVYLEVEPQPAAISTLFGDLPIRSVWLNEPVLALGPSGACEGGVEDVACPVSTPIQWRFWFAGAEPANLVSTLRTLEGGKSYLIDATRPVTVTLRGAPNASSTMWREGFNLTGFHVTREAAKAPSFNTYLGGSPLEQGGEVLELNADGTLAPIRNPDQQRIVAGRAYWVQSPYAGRYDGPIQIDSGSLRGLQWSGGAARHALDVQNLTSQPRSIRLQASFPQAGDDAASRKAAPLLWRGLDESGAAVWRPIEEFSLLLPSRGSPGSGSSVRLATPSGTTQAPDGGGEALAPLNGLLTIVDDAGFVRTISLRLEGAEQIGLWVGNVTLTAVRPLTTEDPNPTPVGTPFVFRVIIHKSATKYRLLRDVVLAYQPDQQSYALVTSDCPELLNEAEASPRVSSANFSFTGTVPLSGHFATRLAPLSPLTIGASEPLNPFRHAFNPVHETGWDIERSPVFTFDEDGGGDPDWGVTWLAGDYAESVLLKDPGDEAYQVRVECSGRFELRKVSSVADLCAP